MLIIQNFEVSWSHGRCHPTKGSPRFHNDSLCHRVIMIASHSGKSILAYPVDAGQGISGVVDNVAQKQTGIESLIDRRQRWPVCMDVGQQKDSHGSLGTHILREKF
jgi:hypothetical protein